MQCKDIFITHSPFVPYHFSIAYKEWDTKNDFSVQIEIPSFDITKMDEEKLYNKIKLYITFT